MSDLYRAAVPQQGDAVALEQVPELYEIGSGTAYVESVIFNGDGSLLRLLYPGGHTTLVSTSIVPSAPDFAPMPAVQRALAVQVRTCASGVGCSVVGTSGSGPKRLPISFRQALALASSGVHTTVRSK